MSEEEWSLKGRKIYYVINIEDGRKSHIKENKLDEKMKIISSFYSKKDIETLRQKLIEDIKEWSNQFWKSHHYEEELIEIINKRFGDER